ncbi:MAG: M28 family peptidase [Phycisphaerales bacterium]
MFEQLGPDAAEWYQHVLTLSNPNFEGRAPGTPGMERAADYVEWWIKRNGLKPAFPAESDAAPASSSERAGGAAAGAATVSTAPWTSHRQYFNLPGGGIEVKRGELALLAAGAPAGGALKRDDEFVVLGSSGSGEISAPLVFVGYGIKEGKNGYTSFGPETRLDGRIAVLFRYEPMDEEGQSLWSDRRFSEYAAILPKLNELAARGAAGVIMVNPPGSKYGKRGLETTDSSQFGGEFRIPLVQVSEDVAERLLAAADPDAAGRPGAAGRSLMQWRRLADTGEAKSVNLAEGAKVRLATDVSVKKIRACNLGGVLPGRGELASEWLIIGAHYDHVGMGYFGTAPANRGQLHPGADDNASGTSAVLLLARRFVEQYKNAPPEQPLRSILLCSPRRSRASMGSRYYAQSNGHRRQDDRDDQPGHGRPPATTSLSVSGTGTAEGFMDIVGAARQERASPSR